MAAWLLIIGFDVGVAFGAMAEYFLLLRLGYLAKR